MEVESVFVVEFLRELEVFFSINSEFKEISELVFNFKSFLSG